MPFFCFYVKMTIEVKMKKIKEWAYRDKRIFAEGLSGTKLYIIYIIGSIFGVYFEQIRNLIKSLINNGTWFWEYRRGLIYGPFNPLYGFGAMILVWLLLRKPLSNLKTFIYGSLIGGIVEYLVSFLQETFTGTTSWDYTGFIGNINGRTNIPYMLVWGLLAFILVKVIYPFVSKLIEKIPYNVGRLCVNCMHVFMFVNCFLSFGAIIRWNFRHQGMKPFSFLGKFFDKVYPDNFLIKHYPNMKFR